VNPVLEGWRGLAALLVMLAHFGPIAGLENAVTQTAFTGVDLFFVLSGFVFAPILFGEPQNWSAYAIRRAVRIIPAYWLAVMVYALLLWVQTDSAGPWLEHLFFLHLSNPQSAFALNPAFWSLVPEVEFYLALPFLALWMRGSLSKFWALVVIALLLRLGLSHLAHRETANLAFVLMHHLPGMLIEFLLGSVVWKLRIQNRGALAIGLVLWGGLALAFGRLGDARFDELLGPGSVSLIAAAAAALMVAGSLQLHIDNGLLRQVMLWAGGLSYTVYLFHNAALKVAPSLWLAIALTFGTAALVHLALESPARRLGRRFAAKL
jgi:peptidoglycan/LPS O-acetylase OafA/YrhL